uniref:Tenascin Cb n=1 Tax=Myripristis murdjan TaxID=586833 RepID=A0A667Y0D6_9TELE
MGTRGILLGCITVALFLQLSTAGLVKKVIRHRRETLMPKKSQENLTLPHPDQPVVFNHIYNINVPSTSLCSVDLDSPGGTELKRKNAQSDLQNTEQMEHTVDGDNQIVFTHRINIPKQACGCDNQLPDIKDILNRLEMLEAEVSSLREQCSSGAGCCGGGAGFIGEDCSQTSCLNNCLGRGRCVEDECICDPGFEGEDCFILSCPDNCSNKGQCINGECVCDIGYQGEDCSELSCLNNCLNYGRCVNGQCVCDKGYAGEDCSIKTCPKDCMGRGECVDGKCICFVGFTGKDCGELTYCSEGKICPVSSPGKIGLVLSNVPLNPSPKTGPCLCILLHAGSSLDAPKDLTVAEVTETTMMLEWRRPLAKLDSYKLVYVSADGHKAEAMLPSSSESHTLRNLTPGMLYTIIHLKGSAHAKHSLLLLTCSMTDLGSPKGVRFSDVTDTSATVHWVVPRARVDSYQVTYVPAHGVDGAESQTVLPNLTPGVTYQVSVIATKGQRESEPGSDSVTTDVDAPQDLAASNIQTESAQLTWKPPRADITGYILSFESADGTVPTAVSYNMAQLSASTEYSVKLQAIAGPKRSRVITTIFTTTGVLYRHPRDCSQALLNGDTSSGLYTVYLGGDESQPVQVYCDMTTDGGGWIVFLRRQSGKLEFFRNWKNYTAGFGDMNDEFWLGLSNLHKITAGGQYELRVDLRDKGETAYAQYDKFSVSEPRTRYKVHVGGYSGTAGDSMTYHHGRPFSTYDHDNDIAVTNCALSYKGAFWYKNCHRVNLMGRYGDNSHSKGVNWFHWKGHEHSIEFAEMKIRPSNFRNLEGRRKRS